LLKIDGKNDQNFYKLAVEMSSKTQQQNPSKEVQDNEVQGEEMNQEIPPCQRCEMEMNRQIQESIAADMIEGSPFYQQFISRIVSEHAKAFGNPIRRAFTENLIELMKERKLIKVFSCYQGVNPLTGLMMMSHSGKNLIDSTMANDFYKWTMALEFNQIKQKHGPQMVKFLVDFRTPRVSQMVMKSPELQQKIRNALSSLASRPHDRATLTSIPNPKVRGFFESCDFSDTLADPFIRDRTVDLKEIGAESKPVIAFYIGRDCYGNVGPIIEICGRHEYASWLETSVLQILFEIIRREDNHARGISEVDALFESLYRTHIAMIETDGKPASLETVIYMAGRRTQGPLFLLLANLYLDHLSVKFKGTSSVWAWNILTNVLRIPLKKFVPMGTHAHELSMLLGGMGFGKYGQIVGHLGYFLTHIYGTEIPFLALPDTFGTECFLEVGRRIFVKLPDGQIVPFLSLIKGFRQDSGSISEFVKLVRSVIPDAKVLASEIGSLADLEEAVRAGCFALGKGGFCGDSEKAFENFLREVFPSLQFISSIEFACKIGQVGDNCNVGKYGDSVGKRKGNNLGCTAQEYERRLDDAVIPTITDSLGQPLNDYTCYLLEIGPSGAVFTPYTPPS
jgi:nicotinic acid phosphoribosyltransferase